MAIYGYARVSTNQQELKAQSAKLREAGATTKTIFKEKYTGKDRKGRKALNEMIELLVEGDEVKVTKIDRLARSIMDLRQVIQEITEKGATVTFLDNNLTFSANTSDPMQNLMLNMLGSFAEFERDLIVTRTQEGKAYKKATNPNFKEGRPKREITPAYQHAYDLLKEGKSYKEVNELTKKGKNDKGISISTLHRIRRQIESEKEA